MYKRHRSVVERCLCSRMVLSSPPAALSVDSAVNGHRYADVSMLGSKSLGEERNWPPCRIIPRHNKHVSRQKTCHYVQMDMGPTFDKKN